MKYVKTQIVMYILWIEGFKYLITNTLSGTATAGDALMFSTVPISESTVFIFYPANFFKR